MRISYQCSLSTYRVQAIECVSDRIFHDIVWAGFHVSAL